MSHTHASCSHETQVAKSALHDPVCGMHLSDASRFKHVHKGETYYFCSAQCLMTFRTTPEAYLQGAVQRAPTNTVPGAAVYTCPMDPEVREDKPGACPKLS